MKYLIDENANTEENELEYSYSNFSYKDIKFDSVLITIDNIIDATKNIEKFKQNEIIYCRNTGDVYIIINKKLEKLG